MKRRRDEKVSGWRLRPALESVGGCAPLRLAEPRAAIWSTVTLGDGPLLSFSPLLSSPLFSAPLLSFPFLISRLQEEDEEGGGRGRNE